MLNKFGPSGHGEAQVQYLDGDFRVISPGTYVRCAVTDARIPLDELKYWSVDLQEAYAIPTAVLQRHFPGAVKGRLRFVVVPAKAAHAPCPIALAARAYTRSAPDDRGSRPALARDDDWREIFSRAP